jgi:ABC-type branched-subunit amino acid transport system substrate-binding protein
VFQKKLYTRSSSQKKTVANYFAILIKILKENKMKKTIFTVATLTTMALALDVNGVMDSVDKKKAVDSVDKTKAATSIVQGDYKSAVKSVDTDKATESVDKAKLMKSLY